MAPTSGNRRPHLASSPFRPIPAPELERFALEDLVTHDAYGLGRVIGVDAGGVTVDFHTQTIRIASPFSRMSKL